MGFLDLDLSDLPGILSIEESLSLSDIDAKPVKEVKDLFRERARTFSGNEPRCDLTVIHRCYPKNNYYFFASYRQTNKGRTLNEIKEDIEMVDIFSETSMEIIDRAFGKNLKSGGWALTVPPRRRHKEGLHFATETGRQIAYKIGIPFYSESAICTSRHRIGAVFEPGNIPEEPNIIVYDDIVTTGSTLTSMQNLLNQYDKTVFFVASIYNKIINKNYEQ